jgi:RNA polymerase sigma factor (TIGR02999 family)
MEPSSPRQVTLLLRAWSEGDQSALEKLTPLVYAELHRAAKRHMAQEPPGHTLQTTALINEVFLRLIDRREVSFENRAHFFAICAQLMRRVLTDFARSRHSQKRGGNAQHISLDESPELSLEPRADLAAIDEALDRLAAFDAAKAKIVELRFFGGLTAEETASVMKAPAETVRRDWRLAKAWLMRELSGEKPDGS